MELLMKVGVNMANFIKWDYTMLYQVRVGMHEHILYRYVNEEKG